MSVIVAIDGPAGSGKSSVSKAVAHKLGFGYLDTGAAYRCLAWACLDSGADLEQQDAIVAHLDAIAQSRPLNAGDQRHSVGDQDVTDAIRGPEVSAAVSQVAKHPLVRSGLNDSFRALAANDERPGIIIEGRDITTVVAPDAPVRILLTADEATRVARRQAEIDGVDASALIARDRADSQVVDFMSAADGVWTLDTTHLTFDQSVEAVIDLIAQNTEISIETGQ
jgi:cytidylate kinase